MTKEELYYQAGRDRDASHDSRNRDLKIATSGLLTLGITVFIVGTSFMEASTDVISWILVFIMALSLGAMIVIGINILITKVWKYPFKLQDIRDNLDNYENKKMIKFMGDKYVTITEYNGTVLSKKARCFNWLLVCAAIECGVLILFRIISLYPSLP